MPLYFNLNFYSTKISINFYVYILVKNKFNLLILEPKTFCKQILVDTFNTPKKNKNNY